MGVRGGHWLFKSPRSHFSQRKEGLAAIREVQQRILTSESAVCDQKQQLAVRAHISTVWKTEAFLPTLALASCMQAAPGTGTQLPAMGPGIRGGYSAKG